MDLIEGKCDLVVECTRKRNLEPAVAYAFVKETGRMMTDGKGNELGEKKYLEFGQGEDERFVIVSTTSQKLDL